MTLATSNETNVKITCWMYKGSYALYVALDIYESVLPKERWWTAMLLVYGGWLKVCRPGTNWMEISLCPVEDTTKLNIIRFRNEIDISDWNQTIWIERLCWKNCCQTISAEILERLITAMSLIQLWEYLVHVNHLDLLVLLRWWKPRIPIVKLAAAVLTEMEM